MKTKILICLLLVSVGMNILLITIPMVHNQYTIAKSELSRNLLTLLKLHKTRGSLPLALPQNDGSRHLLDVEYERVDGDKATMKTLVDKRLPFATIYVGCDINFRKLDW